MSTTSLPTPELVSFAHHLADASAIAVLPFFRGDLAIESKPNDRSRFDPVTQGDRAAEAAIRSKIIETYPDHAILGEEQEDRPGTAPYRWVIDPIDGTRAFILGLPTWGTLIGLECDQVPTIGLMNQPFTGDRFWSNGEHSFFRGKDGVERRITARSSVSLSEAQMACTQPEMFAQGTEAAIFHGMSQSARSCRYGTDCFGYAMLAAGLVDLVVEAGLKPYDIVALIPIIENAGGIVTAWDGGEARHGGRVIAAANASLHAEAIELIAKIGAS